jgi:hypothetical protein
MQKKQNKVLLSADEGDLRKCINQRCKNIAANSNSCTYLNDAQKQHQT